ncbi:MAG: murein L,D-transpeptidase catalytic domain family protein, partial [Bacteroidota bacterium]|nr:murein L,D-transpeptidase catalytic domain family protein [Bacteroidota bacterium]
MKALSHLFYKVTLASMIVTAPAMSTGSNTDANYGSATAKETPVSWNSSTVIKRFVHYNNLVFSTSPDKPLSLERPSPSPTVERSVSDRAVDLSRRTVALVSPESLVLATTVNANSSASAEERTAAHRAELALVINQAAILYSEMNLCKTGLSEQAFEYAWRGYHNLVKKGVIRKKNVLSICDFSQSSHRRRLYVIDIPHKRLLYRTFVAHGQNSGA